MALCYSDLFLIEELNSKILRRGHPYFLYSIIVLSALLLLVFQSWKQMRHQVGVHRVEMQFLALNMGIVGIVVVALNTASSLLDIRGPAQTSPLALFGFQALTAWAIALHRVFDASQVFISLGQRLMLILVLGVGILDLWSLFGKIFPTPADLLLSIAICSTVVFWLDRTSRHWIGLSGEKLTSEIRRAAITLARSGSRPEKLVVTFQALLSQRFHTQFAALLFDQEIRYSGMLDFPADRPAYSALCDIGWATPESLERRRSAPALAELREYLLEHSIGVMVAAPRGSPTPSLIVALGTKLNRWPHTYPEVQRLQNIAELMDNILIHSRLTTQAALKAKIEQVAILSRGLAHDLKNLITPISSFLVHTDGQFSPGTAEHEVHADAKRSVKLMADYVREALFFANQLTPKFELVRLTEISAATSASTAAHLSRHGVALRIESPLECSLVADRALLQRLLSNLVVNATDASAAGSTVVLRIAELRPGWFRLQVCDHGSGISPENLGRIFDPYFTTKEFGNDTRGFGLGLTICQKIVQLHHGVIAVESEPGRGTTIHVDLPQTQDDFPPESTS